MRQYRIRVEEKKSGEREFTPEVRNISKRFKRVVLPFIGWHNINIDNGHCYCSSTRREIYDNVEGAVDAINQYKEYVSELDKDKIKYTYYVNV